MGSAQHIGWSKEQGASTVERQPDDGGHIENLWINEREPSEAPLQT